MGDPRLAVIAPNFAPKVGGIESFLTSLVSHAWPATSTVVAPPQQGDTEWDRGAPFDVERQRLTGRVPPRWLASRRLVSRLENEADVLLFSEWWPAARAAASLRARGRMKEGRAGGALRVLVAYGTEIVAADGRATASMTAAVRSVDLVLAISRYTAAQLKQRVPDCPDVVVINPGVELEPTRSDPEAVRRRLALGGGPVVLTAARLVPRKGHTEFARHWASVLARVPDAQWVVTGDGPCRAALDDLAVPSMRLVGAVDRADLMALFGIADVHVLPGLPSAEVEGFGLVINEAGAAGTPSVTTDVGGAGEALGPGGVLVPAGDTGAVAEAVCDLLLDEPKRRELGRRARLRAEELAWDAVAARFRSVICERIGARAA